MSNRYQKIPTRKFDGVKAYVTSRYPEITPQESDIYVYTTYGDRFDILAQQYYSNSSWWWIISIANSQLLQDSLVIPEGIQIRIPANPLSIVNSFNQINQL